VCKQQRFVGLGDGDGMVILFWTKLMVKTNVHCSTETEQNKANNALKTNNALTSRWDSLQIWQNVSPVCLSVSSTMKIKWWFEL
jgi:hypothetical protein